MGETSRQRESLLWLKAQIDAIVQAPEAKELTADRTFTDGGARIDLNPLVDAVNEAHRLVGLFTKKLHETSAPTSEGYWWYQSFDGEEPVIVAIQRRGRPGSDRAFYGTAPSWDSWVTVPQLSQGGVWLGPVTPPIPWPGT